MPTGAVYKFLDRWRAFCASCANRAHSQADNGKLAITCQLRRPAPTNRSRWYASIVDQLGRTVTAAVWEASGRWQQEGFFRRNRPLQHSQVWRHVRKASSDVTCDNRYVCRRNSSQRKNSKLLARNRWHESLRRREVRVGVKPDVAHSSGPLSPLVRNRAPRNLSVRNLLARSMTPLDQLARNLSLLSGCWRRLETTHGPMPRSLSREASNT